MLLNNWYIPWYMHRMGNILVDAVSDYCELEGNWNAR